jgi:hypothetical protein
MIGVSPESENNVLSFWVEIAYGLILKELELNTQYHHNLSNNSD